MAKTAGKRQRRVGLGMQRAAGVFGARQNSSGQRHLCLIREMAIGITAAQAVQQRVASEKKGRSSGFPGRDATLPVRCRPRYRHAGSGQLAGKQAAAEYRSGQTVYHQEAGDMVDLAVGNRHHQCRIGERIYPYEFDPEKCCTDPANGAGEADRAADKPDPTFERTLARYRDLTDACLASLVAGARAALSVWSFVGLSQSRRQRPACGLVPCDLRCIWRPGAARIAHRGRDRAIPQRFPHP